MTTDFLYFILYQSLYQNTRVLIGTEEISTNQGVRHGCNDVTQTLFNIYFDNIIQTRKLLVNVGIHLNTSICVHTLFLQIIKY